MDLQTIKGLGPAREEKLKQAGVSTVEELARCDIEKVAAATGIPAAQVRELRQRAAAHALMQDVKGVGPATFETLSKAGVESLKELYEASQHWLQAELKLVQRKMKDLQAQAGKVARHVADEAQTPAGRRRLADQAGRMARDTATTVQHASQQALASAQKAARTVQEKAPVALQRAEEGIKAAEARIRDAAAKAEKALRDEAQKAKSFAEDAAGKAKEVAEGAAGKAKSLAEGAAEKAKSLAGKR